MRIREKTRLGENDRNFLIAITSAWRHTEEFWDEMMYAIEDDESIVSIITIVLFLYKNNEGLDAINLLYSYCKLLDFEKFPFEILYEDEEYGMSFLNEFMECSFKHLSSAINFDNESGDNCA